MWRGDIPRTPRDEMVAAINEDIERSGFATGRAYAPWTCDGVIGEFRVAGCPSPFVLTQGMNGRPWDDVWIEAVPGEHDWAPVCASLTCHGRAWQIGVDDMLVAHYVDTKAEITPVSHILAVMATSLYVASQYGVPSEYMLCDVERQEFVQAGWKRFADSTNDTSEFVEAWKRVAADCGDREAEAEADADPAALARILDGMAASGWRPDAGAGQPNTERSADERGKSEKAEMD